LSKLIPIKREKAETYDAVIGVFDQMFKELKELGKKKPEATLSAGKVKLINRVLVDAAKCLEGAPDHKYLDLLDDEALPQYGDAILVLSQYDGALRAFRSRHYGYYDYEN
jgi:hypothetical protein